MRLRPQVPADVPAAARVAVEAMAPYVSADAPGRDAWVRRRTAHLQRTDPRGAWLAEDEATGEALGVGLALVREGVWGLSLLAVRPDRHARGTGGALLDAALTHDEGVQGWLITASTDPRAMRLYARAGFALHPCVSAGGIVDREALPAGLRARPTDDLEQAGALGRAVRGAAYGAEDLALWDGPALLIPGRGFAVARDGTPVVLCATDEAAAADLLWSCFASGPRGGTVSVDFLTAGQDWAVSVCLRAGLALSPEGPLYTRGRLGPLRPWLPSGSLL